MTQEKFITQHQERWKKLELALQVKSELKQIKDLPREFRYLSQNLNTARSRQYDPQLVNRLNNLVMAYHQRIYGIPHFSLRPLLDLILRDFPRALWQNRLAILVSHLLFYGPALILFFLILQDPDRAYDVVSLSALEEMEEMYNPASAHFLSPRGIEADAQMFGFYVSNNISVAFRTFAGGAAAGIGSLLLLCLNSLQLGAIAAHLTNQGMGSTFFPFIVGHSSFELTALVLSALAGLKLGWSLFVPGRRTRGEALRETAAAQLPLIYGTVILLLIAAIIEAFWSSQPLPAALKYGAGALGWAVVGLYMIGGALLNRKKNETGAQG